MSGYYRDHPDYGGEVDHAELISRLASTFDAWALSTSARSLPEVLALCPSGVRVAAWFRGHRPHATATTPLNAWEPVIYAGQIRRARPAQDDASRSPAVDASSMSTCDRSRGDGEHLSRSDRQHVADRHGDPSPLEGRPVAEIPSDTSRQYSGRVAQVLDDASPLDRGHVAAAPLDASRRPGERIDTLHYFSRPRLTDSGRVIGAKPAAFCRWIFELLGAQPGDELVDVFPGSGGIGRAWDIYTGAAS